MLGGAVITFTSSAIDLVSGNVATTCSPVSGSVLALGTTNVTCSATDAAGVTGTTTLKVTVVDTTAPAITMSGSSTVTVEAGSVYTDGGAAASDLVAGPVAVTQANNIQLLVPGTYSVTYRSTDPSGNTGTATRTVIVRDTTPPSITLSGPVLPVEGNVLGGAVITFTSSAIDLVSGNVATTCSPVSGSVLAVGTTTVTCSATDTAGITGTKTLAVTVVDTTAPVVSLNGSAIVTIEIGSAWVDPGASARDIVSGVLGVGIAGAVNTGVVGTYTLTYRSTDAAQNAGSVTRTVKVADRQAPVVTIAASPSTLIWSPNKVMKPVTISGVITDPTLTAASFKVVDEYGRIQPSGTLTVATTGAYSVVVMLEAYRNGTDADGRLYTISVTATDASGNVRTVATYVRVPHSQ